MTLVSQMNVNETRQHGTSGYAVISQQVLDQIASRYSWIAEPISRASDYVSEMPFFDFVDSMVSPADFRECAVQLWYHSATFPKVMGLMLGLTPLAENHMMSFYSEHAHGEAPHHQMLMDWILRHKLLERERQIADIVPTLETNACVNFSYQMAIEQNRDKWLVALNCGIERCSNQFFKALSPKMHALGAGDGYFDVHVEADEHHSIMGLDYIRKDLTTKEQEVLVRKAMEGISLWAAMIHSWIGMSALPVFDLDGSLLARRSLDLRRDSRQLR
jgi:Iron-containing redox enzyme